MHPASLVSLSVSAADARDEEELMWRRGDGAVINWGRLSRLFGLRLRDATQS